GRRTQDHASFGPPVRGHRCRRARTSGRRLRRRLHDVVVLFQLQDRHRQGGRLRLRRAAVVGQGGDRPQAHQPVEAGGARARRGEASGQRASAGRRPREAAGAAAHGPVHRTAGAGAPRSAWRWRAGRGRRRRHAEGAGPLPAALQRSDWRECRRLHERHRSRPGHRRRSAPRPRHVRRDHRAV
ncbi:MAG: hypothetical protein AVDCRST_MAG10-3210, partial [uncultured Acidimicrobiales bacterium]